MEIIEVKIKDLKPAEYNPRQLTKKQAEDLTRSIKEFGMVEPIVVNKHKGRENVIVGGHQRYNICKQLEWEKIPVVYVDLNEEKEKKLNLRLNKNVGEWNWDMIANFDEELLRDVGFDEELEKLFPKPIEEDELPEIEEGEPDSKLGEVYELGRHRLMCGDATKIEDVEKLMNGQKADMVFTDPPYSVNYEKKNKEVLKSDSYSKITNDDMQVDDIAKELWKPAFDNMAVLSKDGASIYVTMPQGGDQMMMMMMMMDSWQVKHELIWVKPSPVFSMGRLDYDYMHEPIIYGWKKNHTFYGGGEFKKSVWTIGRDGDTSHPTMKPVQLMANALKNSSKEGDICMDLFGGSGSTLIACEQTNRTCYMMELDPKYCDVIRKRYQQYKENE